MNGHKTDPRPSASDATLSQLATAQRRAKYAILWERLWPNLARLLTVAGLFLFVSWAGLWLALPAIGRAVGLAAFALLALAASLPLIRLRWPGDGDALKRLDLNTGVRHRPATALTDTMASTDPVAQALWQAQRERTLAALKKLRAGLPTPRLALHDPWALRALVIMALVAAAFAAGEERRARIAAAFDWQGVLPVSTARLDAWVKPPDYTGRPPVILSGLPNGQAGVDSTRALQVPSGSILQIRASGGRLDVAVTGGVTEAPPDEKAVSAGAEERRYLITGDGAAQVRAPSGQPQWRFAATPDRAPTIALAKDPERQARGSLVMSYKLEDDYGVIDARASFSVRAQQDQAKAGNVAEPSAAPRPLYDPPAFSLVLPNARTRNGVGQTIKDLSEHAFAGADMTLTLTARDEAGNEGVSDPFEMRLPERLFTKPVARALIEQRRALALDAGRQEWVALALDAVLVAPELFMPEFGHYLGLRSIQDLIRRAKTDDSLREVVGAMWALAVTIEDGDITDVDKALRAAQEALREALERGASDEEIKKLTDQLRAALDNFMRQLAERLKNNPQQLARPLDRNSRVLSQQDLKNMIDRMERLSRSGDKDAARQMLEQLQQMLENLQMAQPGQGGDSELEQSMNELNDIIRKEQQLRDRTYRQGQDARRDRQRGQNGSRNQFGDLQQDQQGLRDRLQQLLDQLAKQGMKPGRGDKGQQGDNAQDGAPGQPGQGEEGIEGLGEADSAMDDAGGRLGDGNADGAVDSQGRALDALRRGAKGLREAMQQQQGDQPGDGPGERIGRQQSQGTATDPLGRPLRGREYSDDLSVKIPGEIDVQRARRILEELRRRLSEPTRPQVELDYIERLLKD